MDLPAHLAWLVDEASAAPDPDRFLAALGSQLLVDGLPLAGGVLTLPVPHPIIARRTWLWRAEGDAVIEALGFAGALDNVGLDWLVGLGRVAGEQCRLRAEQPSAGLGRDTTFCTRRVLAAAASRALRRGALGRLGGAGGGDCAA